MKNHVKNIFAAVAAAAIIAGAGQDIAISASASGFSRLSYSDLQGSKSSSSSSTSKSSSTNKTTSTTKVSGSIADIKKVCGLVSEVETSVKACVVDVNSKVNPYDVVYDYGKDYDAFVAKCDWSLVFDADYYIEQFPMLAMQYHNDKDLLLKHFQTVGIQEGRQGNAKFNVGVYKANCAESVSKAFGNEYEGYYFYYMLNYSSQKSVKTTAKNSKIQQTIVMTALQAEELKGNNKYRSDAKVATLKFDSEAAAFANYRAWVNVHDGYKGHDWLHSHENTVMNTVMPCLNDAMSYNENTCAHYHLGLVGCTHASCYGNSKGHYATLTNAEYDFIGVSNSYASKSEDYTVQLDVFYGLD